MNSALKKSDKVQFGKVAQQFCLKAKVKINGLIKKCFSDGSLQREVNFSKMFILAFEVNCEMSLINIFLLDNFKSTVTCRNERLNQALILRKVKQYHYQRFTGYVRRYIRYNVLYYFMQVKRFLKEKA